MNIAARYGVAPRAGEGSAAILRKAIDSAHRDETDTTHAGSERSVGAPARTAATDSSSARESGSGTNDGEAAPLPPIGNVGRNLDLRL